MGRGFGMGNTCKPMAVSFQCMTKFTTNKIIIIIIIIIINKNKKIKNKCKASGIQEPDHSSQKSITQFVKQLLSDIELFWNI